jgi:hypothetical protein
MMMTEEEQPMTAPTRESQRFNIVDGTRPLTFTGHQVAAADSQSGFDVRWTELTLYQTTSGKYILEKVGRSDVFHSERCRRGTKGVRFDTLEDAVPVDADDNDTFEDIFVPCTDCKPDYTVQPAWVERDIASVSMFETASQMVDSLYRPDRDKPRFLSRVARILLEKAALDDPEIARVLALPADIT